MSISRPSTFDKVAAKNKANEAKEAEAETPNQKHQINEEKTAVSEKSEEEVKSSGRTYLEHLALKNQKVDSTTVDKEHSLRVG